MPLQKWFFHGPVLSPLRPSSGIRAFSAEKPVFPLRYYNQPYSSTRRIPMDFTPSLADVLQSAEKLIAAAIAEDIGPGDPPSLAIFSPYTKARATIIAKEPGVVAGLPVARAVFAKADPAVVFTSVVT